MRRTHPVQNNASIPPHHFNSARGFRRVAFFLLGLGSLLASYGQTFVAEWNAAADGGVGPTGLALATEGGKAFLYVADHPRGRVLKFDTTSGAVVATLGRLGSAPGEFNAPYGLAFDPTSGDLYVAERGNNRIQRITKAGASVLTWGTPGTGAGQFAEPIGVAVDAAGDVYVTDHANNRVQKFHVAQSGGTWSATHVASWGTAGGGDGQFNLPYGITADAAGNLWVADGFNGRVQRFNANGVFQASLGSAGTAPGQFVVATWLGLDPNGDLLVTSTSSDPQNAAAADANNQWISRFTSAGVFVSRFGGTYGESAGQFRLPFSAVAGPANRLYVADYYNSRIQVFDVSGASSGTGGTGNTGGTTGPDTTPPTVSNITLGATTTTSVTFQIAFSETVSGVDAADFALVASGGASGTIGAVSGSGANYSVPVSFMGTGTLQLNLKPSGTGIVDAAGNALAAGATGPTYTIALPGGGSNAGNGSGGGDVSGTRILAVVPPSNGTYRKNQELVFTVRFSDKATLSSAPRDHDDDRKAKPHADRDDDDDDDHDDEDDDAPAYFTWTSVGSAGGHNLSGRVAYKSGSGTSTWTFRYKVRNGDLAPSGLQLGAALELGRGVTIRDAKGVALASAQLALPWPQNPLTGVIIDAPKSNNGKGPGKPDDHGPEGHGHDRLGNLSSRLRVTGGDASKSVVAGFVVSGTAPKAILIRAIGPGLAAFGIREALAQPRLQLRDSTGKLLAENDGWSNRLEISLAGDRVGAFRLAPGSRDAALLVALAPGAYTAQIAANGNGVALIEVYDASTGDELTTEQIVNISTRGFVGAGEDAIVAGFVITGRSPRRVLIRGIGPGLAPLGVSGTLADPVLKLFGANGNSPLAQNDNWQTTQASGASPAPGGAADVVAATRATGAFPLADGSKDAALLLTLPPGSYSVVMNGANNATGAALIEIYEVP